MKGFIATRQQSPHRGCAEPQIGKIKPAIGHLFSLDDAPLAMKEMEERRIQGKALVVTDAFRERHPDVDLETFSTLDAAGSARL